MSVRGTYQVKDVSRIAGVSIRTLHYYEEIGLLVPTARTDAGYRLYSDRDLLRLQQILIGRELGLPLEEVRRALDDPGFDLRQALLAQRKQLEQRARHTADMIAAVDAALAVVTQPGEERPMDQIFDGFTASKHDAEAQQRWGDTPAYEEAARRVKGYTPEQWTHLRTETNAIYSEAAALMKAGAVSGGRGRTRNRGAAPHADRPMVLPVQPRDASGARLAVRERRALRLFDRRARTRTGDVPRRCNPGERGAQPGLMRRHGGDCRDLADHCCLQVVSTVESCTMETLTRMMQPGATSTNRTTALTWIGRILAAALVCATAACQPHTVMSVPADDAEMNRWIERARAEVDTFIARLEKPAPGDRNFALKAPIKDGEDVEHFWLDDVRYRDGFFEGTIGNDPALVKNVKFGDSWRVARSEISDWMFVENDKLVGGYTLRVMLDRLDAEERKAMLASLDFKVE